MGGNPSTDSSLIRPKGALDPLHPPADLDPDLLGDGRGIRQQERPGITRSLGIQPAWLRPVDQRTPLRVPRNAPGVAEAVEYFRPVSKGVLSRLGGAGERRVSAGDGPRRIETEENLALDERTAPLPARAETWNQGGEAFGAPGPVIIQAENQADRFRDPPGVFSGKRYGPSSLARLGDGPIRLDGGQDPRSPSS